MDRTERLLNLVALFLDSPRPLGFRELRQIFAEDYGGGSSESAARKFERDKADLLELGVPLEHVNATDEQDEGYRLERNEYYLPPLDLSASEMALLYSVGAAAASNPTFPFSDALTHALRKIGFHAGPSVHASAARVEVHTGTSESLKGALEQLWFAAAHRKRIALTYYSPHRDEVTTRTVEPYGLALRRGVWSLVGRCLLRKDLRTFHVQRIRSFEVHSAKPKTPDFEVPADFVLKDHVAEFPWQHRFHAPVQCRVRIHGRSVAQAAQWLPGASFESETTGCLASVSVTSIQGLVQHVLSLGADAEVSGPPEAARAFAEALSSIVEAHT